MEIQMPARFENHSLVLEINGETTTFTRSPDNCRNLVLILTKIQEQGLVTKEKFAALVSNLTTVANSVSIAERIASLIKPQPTDPQWHQKQGAFEVFSAFLAALREMHGMEAPISFHSSSCFPERFTDKKEDVRVIGEEEKETNDFIFRVCMTLGGVRFEDSKTYNPEARQRLLRAVEEERLRTDQIIASLLRPTVVQA